MAQAGYKVKQLPLCDIQLCYTIQGPNPLALRVPRDCTCDPVDCNIKKQTCEVTSYTKNNMEFLPNVKWFLMNSAALAYYWTLAQKEWTGVDVYQRGWQINNIFHLVLWIGMALAWVFNFVGNALRIDFLGLQFTFMLWVFQIAFPLTFVTDVLILIGRNDMFKEEWTPSEDSTFYFMGKLMIELLTFAYGTHLRGPLIAKELKFTAPVEDPEDSLF